MRKLSHYEDTVKGVELSLTEEQKQKLKKAADENLELGFPHNFVGQSYEDGICNDPVVFFSMFS